AAPAPDQDEERQAPEEQGAEGVEQRDRPEERARGHAPPWRRPAPASRRPARRPRPWSEAGGGRRRGCPPPLPGREPHPEGLGDDLPVVRGMFRAPQERLRHLGHPEGAEGAVFAPVAALLAPDFERPAE